MQVQAVFLKSLEQTCMSSCSVSFIKQASCNVLTCAPIPPQKLQLGDNIPHLLQKTVCHADDCRVNMFLCCYTAVSWPLKQNELCLNVAGQIHI